MSGVRRSGGMPVAMSDRREEALTAGTFTFNRYLKYRHGFPSKEIQIFFTQTRDTTDR